MSTNEPQPVVYQPGQIVNGHVWTGTEWLPVVQAAKPAGSSSPWLTLGIIVSFVVAGLAGIQGIYWMFGGIDLENQGNPFAGILTLLGMGALVVAAGFVILGFVLMNKRR
jgi:hypothetical protein